MVAIGEETGSLDVMLSKLADLYETEVASMASRMQALLEPVMILVLAAVVGLIVLAVLAPEFKLIQVLH
ncbi:MAG: type II secretion system F family protein [Firmicutes bacterium]|nr:type II secretion system F family protein [Bacillota bacterium]